MKGQIEHKKIIMGKESKIWSSYLMRISSLGMQCL